MSLNLDRASPAGPYAAIHRGNKPHCKTGNFTGSPIFKIIEVRGFNYLGVNSICIMELWYCVRENGVSKFLCNFEKNGILTISKNFKSTFFKLDYP